LDVTIPVERPNVAVAAAAAKECSTIGDPASFHAGNDRKCGAGLTVTPFP
jgi:hypothetical protein